MHNPFIAIQIKLKYSRLIQLSLSTLKVLKEACKSNLSISIVMTFNYLFNMSVHNDDIYTNSKFSLVSLQANNVIAQCRYC